MRAIALATLALCAGAGCHRNTPLTVVTLAERARIDAAEKTQLAVNAARVCKRPVLRGVPTPGRADDDIVAVDAPRVDQPLGVCITTLQAWKKAHDGAHEEPSDDVLDKCATLPDAVARAVSHEDACSPYAEGRKPLDASLTPVLEARALRALVARQLAHHEPMRAAHMVLDFLRLQQDVRRGRGASVTRALLGVAATQVLVDAGKRPLIVTASLNATELAELAQELTTLEDTDPPFADMVHLDDGGVEMPPLPPNIDPSDVHYLYMLAKAQAEQRVMEACPPTANAVACYAAIGARADALAAAAQPIPATFAKLDPTYVRDTLVAHMLPDEVRVWRKEAAQFWLGRFDQRVARLQLFIAQHHCPAVETIIESAGPLAIDPANGETLLLQMGEGGLTVGASTKLDGEAFATYRARTYPIACTPRQN